MLKKLKNLNFLLIFLIILLSFIGAAGLYSAAEGSYYPWAGKHLLRSINFFILCYYYWFNEFKNILQICISHFYFKFVTFVFC